MGYTFLECVRPRKIGHLTKVAKKGKGCTFHCLFFFLYVKRKAISDVLSKLLEIN